MHQLAVEQLCVSVFFLSFFSFNGFVLVQWKRHNLAIARYLSWLYHKACHTSARIPLTSPVPADFLQWCSQRAAKTHGYAHTLTLMLTHQCLCTTTVMCKPTFTPCSDGDTMLPRVWTAEAEIYSFTSQIWYKNSICVFANLSSMLQLGLFLIACI